MGNIIQGYFQNLFSSEVGDPDSSVIAEVPRRITPEMNEGLLNTFTHEEVKRALFQIGDLKAPGPDGMHAVFYKRFWEIR